MLDVAKFDLAADSDRGVEVTLKHPISGEALDAKVTVVGPDSATMRKATRELLDMMYREQRATKKCDDAALERRAAEAAASITLGWSGLQWDGKDFPFSAANAVKLYTERRWVREQVEAFAQDRANFFRE